MIKFLNECLICFIPQLRHFDGCAIKAPPSIRDVFQREIEMRLQMEILYSFLWRVITASAPTYRHSRSEIVIEKGEYKAFSCFSFFFR